MGYYKQRDLDDILKILSSGKLSIGCNIKDIHDLLDCTKSKEYREFELKGGATSKDKACEISILRFNSTEVVFCNTLGKGKKAILNFASSKNPGGGWRKCAMAQEESLCMSSNLGVELEKHMEFYEYNRKNLHRGLYSDGIIYSKDVVFFKLKGKNEIPILCDVITCAAPNAFAAKKNGVADSEIDKTMQRRIEQIMITAINNDVEILVLGAFGCGVFKNNPESVARTMMNCLESYGKYFERVVFPLIGKQDKNYIIFGNEINKHKIKN